jgi:hypothetical protein
VSAYATLRDALAEKIEALAVDGGTLPIDTTVYRGMSPDRFMQESCVLGINVALASMTTPDSELLGDAVFQPETWAWDVVVSSMGAAAHDDGAERAWDAIEAIRVAFCPSNGWRPESKSDVVMFEGVSPVGQTATGAVVFSARFKHYRNLG